MHRTNNTAKSFSNILFGLYVKPESFEYAFAVSRAA
jgi:hypothetical protein